MLYPGHNQINGKFFLVFGQFRSGRNPMPFIKTLAAAGCRGMLSNKYRMIPHWCLLPVILNNRRSQTAADKIPGMHADNRQTFLCDIGPVFN